MKVLHESHADKPDAVRRFEREAEALARIRSDHVLEVIDVLRTHRTVIVGGVLQDNPFFVPPEQFLFEIKARQSERDVAIGS